MRKVVKARSPKAAAILGTIVHIYSRVAITHSLRNLASTVLHFHFCCLFFGVLETSHTGLTRYLCAFLQTYLKYQFGKLYWLRNVRSYRVGVHPRQHDGLLTLFCCAVHYADYLKRENKPMRIVSIRWQIIRTNDDFQTSRTTLCRCVVVQICPLFDLHGVMTFLSPDKRHFATGWSGQKEIDQVLSRGTAPTQCAQSKALYSKWVEWVRLSGGRLGPAGAHTTSAVSRFLPILTELTELTNILSTMFATAVKVLPNSLTTLYCIMFNSLLLMWRLLQRIINQRTWNFNPFELKLEDGNR